MKIKLITKRLTYTGAELRSLFAYRAADLQGDSVVAFVGPCYVDLKHLVDQEDVKAKAYIKSDLMVHFIAEVFDLDLRAGVYRQRLYILIIKEVLEELKPDLKILRQGDDLFLNKGKLSVSIATLSPVSTLIHIGINISAKNTPVKTSSLNDIGVDPKKFANMVLKKIEAEEKEMYLAKCKVRGVK